MLFYKDLINEHLSQDFSVLCTLVLTVQGILAAVYRIDLSGTPCIHVRNTCPSKQKLICPLFIWPAYLQKWLTNN